VSKCTACAGRSQARGDLDHGSKRDPDRIAARFSGQGSVLTIVERDGTAVAFLANMRFALIWVAVSAAACATSFEEESVGTESDVKHPSSAPMIAPLAETSLVKLGAYASPVARSEGQPKLAEGIVVFTPRYQLWSDGATKRRFVQLPKGAKIAIDAAGAWTFPTGTRIYKEFYKGGYLHETRVIEKGATEFKIATYLWNKEGTDATLDTEGGTLGDGETLHNVPSQRECAGCHNDDKNPVLGLSFVQMNPEMSEADKKALFVKAPAAFEWPATATKEMQTTLGYLHANCGHCHNDADDGSSFLTLRPSESGKAPEGIRAFVDTRDSATSILRRIKSGSMPKLGVSVPDPRAVDANGDIRKGIESIGATLKTPDQ
jgi:hypothetical protein